VIPLTRPVLLTLATEVLEDTQGLTAAGDVEPLNCVVDPSHTLSIPLIVGSGLTVNVAIADCTEEQV
jgi:hypothetical protein